VELRHLKDFVVVAEELSFTKAAALLYTTQSSLSRRIRQLEQELDARLFDRSTSHVRLTEAGRLFLRDARRILDLSSESMRAVRALTTEGARALRIGYTRHVHYHQLPVVLDEYARAWPGIDVTLHPMTPARLLDALQDGAIDVAFLVEFDGVRGERLGLYSTVVAVPTSSALAKRDAVTLEDFHDALMVIVGDQASPGVRERVLALWAGSGGAPHLIEVAERFEDAINFVASGLGTALLPAHGAWHIDHETVALLEFDPPLRFGFWLMWDEQRAEAAEHVRAFVRTVRDVRSESVEPFFVPR
jgi:DNA-binding transcriptional LysR family regulator